MHIWGPWRSGLSPESQGFVSGSANKTCPRHTQRRLYLPRKPATLALQIAGHSQGAGEFSCLPSTFTEVLNAGPGEGLGGPACLLFSRLGLRLNPSRCLFALCIASPQQHVEHREVKLTVTSLLRMWEGLRVGLVRLAAERLGCTVSSTGSPSWAGRLPHLTSWRLLHKLPQPQKLNPRRWRLCLCSLPFAIPTPTTYVPDAYQILCACLLNNKCLFLNFLFHIGIELIDNVVIVSGVQQSDSVIHAHVSILFQNLFLFRLSHNIEPSSLCYTLSPCWLSTLNIAVCTCQSQTP